MTDFRLFLMPDKLFLSNMGSGGVRSFLFWVQYLSAQGIGELCNVFELWWLGYWASQYAYRDPESVKAI